MALSDKRDINGQHGTTGVSWVVRSTSFLLPLILAGAYLNMGQASCGGDGSYRCQGRAATHVFYEGTHVATDGGDVIVLVVGDSQPATVFAGGGDDFVCLISHAANDEITIYGGDGNDTVHGGDAGENLHGEAGADVLFGGPGDDYLKGGDSHDILRGDAGADDLYGDAGNDFLRGNAGADQLNGGSGNDTAITCRDGDPIYSIESVSYDDPTCPVESQPIISARLEIEVGNCPGDINDLIDDPNLPPFTEAKIHPYAVSIDGVKEETFFGDLAVYTQFAEGTTHIHDFLMPGTVNDIREITIRNANYSTWANWDVSCISRIRLGVNHLTEGTAAATRTWLFDTNETYRHHYLVEDTLTLSFNNLRANPNWTEANVTLLDEIADTGLDYETLERLLEGVLAEAIQGEPLTWDIPGTGNEVVSAEPGTGDDVGSSTDSCNDIEEPALCALDWQDLNEVCSLYPNMLCCSPNDFCDWSAVSLPINPCIWRSSMCQFPSHADIHVDLKKTTGAGILDNVDVSFMLKVACSTEANELKIEPDKFHVDAQGIFGGKLWEKRVGDTLLDMGADLAEMIPLPEETPCALGDPRFDRCGLWFSMETRPDPDNPTHPHSPGDRCQ